ncbi:biotin transporter BioY, partial [Thermodesulfovibrionales bacterium]|nr:biotin transporter BioY [Thermodesulfovibrionales bacterium]
CAAGLVVIYTMGVLQLSIVADLSIIKAIAVGVVPFVLTAPLQVIGAVLVALKVREMIKP